MELYKEKNHTEIFELDGTGYEFYVREPETKDRISYLANSIKKSNGKIIGNIENVYENKYESGCLLITGFPENNSEGKPQFEYQGKAVSSDPDSPNYRKDWKELILSNFFNRILLFSTKVYEGINLNSKLKEAEQMLEGEVLSDESPLESN